MCHRQNMLVVDSRSLTKPHSTELTCTFEYAAPHVGVSTNNVLASDTMVDINGKTITT